MKTFLTQRRKAAKEGRNSAHLCGFAPLRDIPCPSQRWRLFRKPIRDALDPMLDQMFSEVDQQPESFIHQPQIGQDLAVDRVERGDRFHFHKDAIIDDQVRAESFIEPDPIPRDWHRDLSFHQIAGFAQFMREGNFVHDLENARTKPAVETVGSIDDPCRDFIFFHKPSLCFIDGTKKQKITQRRKGAKGEILLIFAPLRLCVTPLSPHENPAATEMDYTRLAGRIPRITRLAVCRLLEFDQQLRT
jgi:hypothetical protein